MDLLNSIFPNNPLFTASLLAGGMGIAMGVFNSIFKAFNLEIITSKFFTVLSVHSQSPAYSELIQIISTKSLLKKSRKLSLIDMDLSDEGTLHYSLGYGTLYMFWKGRLFTLQRSSKKQEGGSNVSMSLLEDLTISVFLGTQKHLDDFLKNLIRERDQDKTSISLHVSVSWWLNLNKIKKRYYDSLFLPDKLKESLREDVTLFRDSQKAYEDKSLKWKRGYLFHGIPGTGKSSLAHWIASELDFGIYVFNLKGIREEADFYQMFLQVPVKSVILLEDLDTLQFTQQRRKNAKNSTEFLSLSSLLNVLDGVLARSGIVTVITTNHLDQLDKALIRPGRMDYIVEIPPIGKELNHKMAKWYLGDNYLELLGDDAKLLNKTQPGAHMLTPIQKAFKNYSKEHQHEN